MLIKLSYSLDSWFCFLTQSETFVRDRCSHSFPSQVHSKNCLSSWVLWSDSKERFIHESDIASRVLLWMISQNGAVVKLLFCLIFPQVQPWWDTPYISPHLRRNPPIFDLHKKLDGAKNSSAVLWLSLWVMLAQLWRADERELLWILVNEPALSSLCFSHDSAVIVFGWLSQSASRHTELLHRKRQRSTEQMLVLEHFQSFLNRRYATAIDEYEQPTPLLFLQQNI